MSVHANNIKTRNNNAAANSIATPVGSPVTVTNNTSARTTPSSVLGSGGFGCVLSPPLPNMNEAGSPVNLPGEVMKVFFQGSAVDKAVRNAETLRTINNADAPLFSYPIKKYRAAYTKGNIPAALRVNCKIEPTNNLSAPIHAVHMPNLGVSFADVASVRTAVAGLPLRTILNGFKDLFNTVKTLYSRELIHRDIKPQNIMIEPTTGRMTIIDFDLLTSVRNLVGSTSPAQWNSPPETVFWSVDNAFSLETEIDSREDPEGAELQADEQEFAVEELKLNIMRRVGIYADSISILPAYRDDDAFLDALGGWFTKWFVAAKAMKNPDGTPYLNTSKRMKIYFKILSKDTFDSFCVAFSIMYFLEKVFPGYNTTAGPLKNLYDTVLVPMVDFNPQTRMRVGPALAQIDTIITGLAAGGYRQKNQKNKTAKNKIQKAKSSRRGATRVSASRR